MNNLILSIDQDVIDEAIKYAKSNGKSLSEIIEEHLKSLLMFENLDNNESIKQLIVDLKGSVKVPEMPISYKDVLQDALIEKYLKNEK